MPFHTPRRARYARSSACNQVKVNLTQAPKLTLPRNISETNRTDIRHIHADSPWQQIMKRRWMYPGSPRIVSRCNCRETKNALHRVRFGACLALSLCVAASSQARETPTEPSNELISRTER